MTSTRGLTKLLALLFTIAMLAAACGGSSSDAGSSSDGGGDTDDTAETEESTNTTQVDTEVEVSDSERTFGGSISIGLEAEAPGLRPWEDALSSPSYNVATAIFDKIVDQTAEGGYEGWLAESVEPNEDFTVWTVTLRPDVVFHNGVALTAQTLVDMFELQKEGATSQGHISATTLQSVEATGDLEATYTLQLPNSAFIAYLSRAPLGMVFEPAAAAADIDGAANAPVGTGPFQIDSRDLDNETVVVRNENYWLSDADGNQLPYLDSISFKPIPDEGARLDSLLSGTVNGFQTLRQGTIRNTIVAEEDGADIKLLQYQGNNTGGGMFNMMKAPFDDLRVRKGLNMLNNQEQVIIALGGEGISDPATQWFSPDNPYYSETVAAAWPTFDFEGGTALIQEYVDDPERSDGKAAGEPIDVELSCPPDPSLLAAMQVIDDVWSQTNLVNVNLTNFDQQTHINNAIGGDSGFVGDHGAHCWRWSDDNDPSTSINAFLAPPTAEIAAEAGASAPGALNVSNWWSPESFELAQQAVLTDDFDERKALYEQIMMNIVEEQPIWYSGYTATMFALDSNIEGLNGWHLPSGSVGVGFPGAEGRWAEVWVTQ